MKKGVVILLLLVLALSITFANGAKEASTTSSQDNFNWPTEPITIMATGAAGGSADTTCRIMAEGLEKYLGVTVNVGNYPGAGGMNAAVEVIYDKPTGYKLAMFVLPNLCVTYINPDLGRSENLDSFTFVANAVTDPGVLIIKGDETRFTDFNSFIEYAKTHEVTIGTSGVASDDDIFCRLIMAKFPECKITPVHYTSAAQVTPAVMGGHIDAGCGNVGDTFTQYKEGEIKIVGVAANERSSFVPEISTFIEMGYDFVTGASRGFGFGDDIDPRIAAKMADAIQKALQDPEIIEKYKATGMEIDCMTLEEYAQFAKYNEETVYGMTDLFGWKL